MGRKISWLLECSTPSETPAPVEVRTRIQHGKAWEGAENCLSGTVFPTLWRSSRYGHIRSSLDGVLLGSNSTCSPRAGDNSLGVVLASVVVVVWFCRYGSFLSQIFINLVLYFLNCKLLNMSSLFRGLLRAPSGGNTETLKQDK